jgi:hypothetical protein
LEKIIFPGSFPVSAAYRHFIESNQSWGPERQLSELEYLAGYFGDSLWNIFSNNHTVITLDGTRFSIGSWRGSGDFIAEFINEKIESACFDYMDFYMGHFHEDPETKPGYQYIFTRLKELQLDWQYEYPSLGIVDFSQHRTADPADYDPNKVLGEEIAKKNVSDTIDRINAEWKDKINSSSIPVIITAYANVYGQYPAGWEAV